MFLISYKNLKNIKIRENFESDTTLDKELIEELLKIRSTNLERFNMLVKSKRTAVFSDINDLKKDAEYFAIFKSYEANLINTTYLNQQFCLNLAKAWPTVKDIFTQLEIRKIALSCMSQDPLQREIIIKLVSSDRRFKSLEHFNYEVAFRLNAVKLMNNQKFHSLDGNYQYPTAEANYLQLNKNYWIQANNKLGLFKVKEEVLPSEAIDSIFDDTTKIVLECHSMMMCIQYKALLDTIGAKNFNLLFKSHPLIIADGLLIGDHKQEMLEIFPHSPVLKKEDYIPGDWLYLSNFQEYSHASLYDYSKDGNGLHTMFMGNEKYRGFGSPLMTEKEAEFHFLEIYNEDFCAFPIELTPENIDMRTMGLESCEEELQIGKKVIIYGHINCPLQEWQHVECIYNGNGRFECSKLEMKSATEEEIILALLKKYNSLLPKKKTEEDLKDLNMFRGAHYVKSINFAGERFNFLFEPALSFKFFDKNKSFETGLSQNMSDLSFN
ncbi:transglutaminase [Legionella sp. PC997]|uniref:transglutaminase n=1 Tax=Legionella sp. PC997 TaxID=2755562 RepID=UPI0015F97B42|nr:transglutaminase [Legionella sp. PC997]QMT61654.1 Protein-glutamine gamma-glutamyltransferase [Legionella sp. PC997]